MSPDQMRARSAEKVKQIMQLAKMLHVKFEARQRVDLKTGMMELTVFFTDTEDYPTDAKASEVAVPDVVQEMKSDQVAPPETAVVIDAEVKEHA